MFDKTQDNFVNLEGIFAEKTRQIMFWTGAGLSTPAKLPTWLEFRNLLCHRADKLLTEVTYGPDQLEHKKALLQLAKVEKDFWKSFSYLYEVLEETTYAETLRTMFRPAEKCAIPSSYRNLIKLVPTGIITTNIDGLVSRAFREDETEGSKSHLEFCGFGCKDFMHALNGTRFFILNLHGNFENSSTWVCRKEEIAALLADTQYNDFLMGCFLTKTVIFVGTTVDDISITTHLDKIRANESTPHFWITSDRSQSTRTFCEKYRILPIYYSANENHIELEHILKLLKEHRSKDIPIERPVVPAKPTIEMSMRNFEDIPLDTLPLNDLRRILNRKVQTILSSESDSVYKNYKEFRKKYSKYIHNSWHVDPPDNDLCEFHLEDEIGDGAFGRVFMAKDENGQTVAVKLLKEDVMRKDDWLQAFRRGVRAMQILNERAISGMVKYISASEMPTFVAMEYVDGIDLKKAIETQQFVDWKDILRVLCEISGIIAKAHGCPERVLHRDIRPANVMLRGYDYSSTDWCVCVLDFDLAFHKGANEVSIQHSSDTNGFLAPEQLDRHSKFTTRSALVDSYGMAMLCYYVIARKLPQPEQSLHAGWDAVLKEHVAAKGCKSWQSLPFRMARLIERCTRVNQAQRLDMTQMHGYICALQTAYSNSTSVNDGELLAEELATRVAIAVDQVENLKWNSDRCEARFLRNSGEEITVRSDGSNIEVIVAWHNDGSVKFEEVRNSMLDLVAAAKTRCVKQQFTNVTTSIEGKGATVDISVEKQQVCRGMNTLVGLIVGMKFAPKVY